MKNSDTFRTRVEKEVFMKFGENCRYGLNIPGFVCTYNISERSRVSSIIDYFRSIGLISGPNRKTKLSEYGERIYAQHNGKSKSKKKKRKSFF